MAWMKERWPTPLQLSSLADETPEGRSIVVLAKQRFNLRERDVQQLHATFVPFTAQTRMSGINIDNRMIRKGSGGCHSPVMLKVTVGNSRRMSSIWSTVSPDQGSTPLVVVEGAKVLGAIALKDIVERR